MNNFPYANRNGITWVQGMEGAKAFQIMPGSNAILMDSENDGRFYIKVSDNVGMCSLRTFKYEEVIEKPVEYVTKDDFAKAMEELKEVLANGKQTV